MIHRLDDSRHHHGVSLSGGYKEKPEMTDLSGGEGQEPDKIPDTPLTIAEDGVHPVRQDGATAPCNDVPRLNLREERIELEYNDINGDEPAMHAAKWARG